MWRSPFLRNFSIKIIGTNKLSELHNDDHFAKSQVKSMISYLSLFKESSLLISMDDKAKVKVGVPCISHLVKSRKFFPKNQGPETLDHDFPIDNGFLIIPSGKYNQLYLNNNISRLFRA